MENHFTLNCRPIFSHSMKEHHYCSRYRILNTPCSLTGFSLLFPLFRISTLLSCMHGLAILCFFKKTTTTAVIAEIAGKKKKKFSDRSDHMETTLSAIAAIVTIIWKAGFAVRNRRKDLQQASREIGRFTRRKRLRHSLTLGNLGLSLQQLCTRSKIFCTVLCRQCMATTCHTA